MNDTFLQNAIWTIEFSKTYALQMDLIDLLNTFKKRHKSCEKNSPEQARIAKRCLKELKKILEKHEVIE